jgi:hypothetical protein
VNQTDAFSTRAGVEVACLSAEEPNYGNRGATLDS